MSEKEFPSKIILKVQTVKQETKQVKVDENATVKELREAISEQFNNTPVKQLCLIFGGKILKDYEEIKSRNIRNGFTIHLVIKTENKQQDEANNTSSTLYEERFPGRNSISDDDLFHLAGLGDFSATAGSGNTFDYLAGFENFGVFATMFSNLTFSGMQEQMIREIMNNPEILRQLLSNPNFQSLITNREILSSFNLLAENPEYILPQMSFLQNPEFLNLLTNHTITEILIQHFHLFSQLPRMTPNMFNIFANVASGTTPDSANVSSSTTQSQPASVSSNSSSISNANASTMSSMIINEPHLDDGCRSQLEQLESMGFFITEINLLALIATNRNIREAVEKLLQQYL